MTPRLDPKRIPVSTGIRRSPNVSTSRCVQCGLRLHVALASRGIHEHVLCTVLSGPAFDELLRRPPLTVLRAQEAPVPT